CDVGGGGRETKALDAVELVGYKGFEPPSPLAEGQLHQNPSAPVHEQIENDELSGMLASKLLYTARRRVNALKQIVEGELAIHRHDDLAVEHESAGPHPAGRTSPPREIAGEGLPGFRLELNRLALAEGQAAEAVPLRLIGPLGSLGKPLDQPRLHGRIGRPQDARAHRGWSAGATARAKAGASSVFRTSPRRTQPRRAMATPYRRLPYSATEWASVEITKRMPGWRADRTQGGAISRRRGSPLISMAAREAAMTSRIASTSQSMGGRERTRRPSAWPQILKHGWAMARVIRAVMRAASSRKR